MREYSANIGDALVYKIRVFAMERSKQEHERARKHATIMAQRVAKKNKMERQAKAL